MGIVACEALKKEIEMVSSGDPEIAYREYLDFGLHSDPKRMKAVIVEKVNSLEGQVDGVFLGYGICQSLRDVDRDLRVPTFRLECDDCIAALLTPAGYENERKKCAGTFFTTPFFAEAGMKRMIKELHLDQPKFQKYDKMWFIRRFFDGYSRVLYVETGAGEDGRHEALSKAFAEELGLKHESTTGTVSLLAEGLVRAKQVAKQRALGA
ncbi:MAG: DUF1638 domain-containing protein [Candidatus Verstraetearchaeota archaeon]|nr:DUF1638 domain-containing protein [Candidatus Verstraetearchaeota archaeon]